MTRWPGRSAGWALPAKTIWIGRFVVPQHPGQPVDVAEQEAGPLVGREPAGEADGQDVRVERGLELGQDRRRLAVAGELAAQPAAREVGELALLAEVRVPQVARRDPLEALPEAAALGARRRGRRGRRRGPRAGSAIGVPIQVGPWMPLVMPRIGWSMTPCQVALAVSAWSWLTALAPLVRRSEKAVMSNWRGSPSTPSPSSRTRSTGTPPSSSRGPATRRTRSASNRSLPAETGVWMVNTLFAPDVGPGRRRASSRPRRARGRARRAGTPSGPR